MHFIENIKKMNVPWDASSYSVIEHNSSDFVAADIKIIKPVVSKDTINSKEIYIPPIIEKELNNYII